MTRSSAPYPPPAVPATSDLFGFECADHPVDRGDPGVLMPRQEMTDTRGGPALHRDIFAAGVLDHGSADHVRQRLEIGSPDSFRHVRGERARPELTVAHEVAEVDRPALVGKVELEAECRREVVVDAEGLQRSQELTYRCQIGRAHV